MRCSRGWGVAIFLLCTSTWRCCAFKDDWLIEWTKAQNPVPVTECFTEPCIIPKYIPPREPASYTQKIPLAIWQTWSSTAVGPKQHNATRSFIKDNPEYEYFFFDDRDAMRFMCHFYAADAAIAYQLLSPGAAKADIWRLAIVYRYGGVYFDSDCVSKRPLREIIWPNASIVTGWGDHHDFHQWGLLYTPRHPIIEAALSSIVNGVLDTYFKHRARPVVDLTGPTVFMSAAWGVMRSRGCAAALEAAVARVELEAVSVECGDVGVIKLFTKDMLGQNVIFKDGRIDSEKELAGHTRYGMLEGQWEQEFKPVPVHINGSTLTLGKCSFSSPLFLYLKFAEHGSI